MYSKPNNEDEKNCFIASAMFKYGDVANMGPDAFVVYTYIKSEIGYENSEALLVIEKIVGDLGLSEPRVRSALGKLVDLGYITKSEMDQYLVVSAFERIPITNAEGNRIGIATWTYIPMFLDQAIQEIEDIIKGMLKEESAKFVDIEWK